MSPSARPPPTVLFIHNGAPFEGHVKHLRNAGLRVTECHAEEALRQALRLQPHFVVLDSDCDGEVTAQLKADSRTKEIPVVALVELMRK